MTEVAQELPVPQGKVGWVADLGGIAGGADAEQPLQPPDLAVQRLGVSPVLDPAPAPPALEQHLESVLGLAFPRGHLMRMHLVGARDLGLAMADSLILATARAQGATLWTQDEGFAGLADVRYFAKAKSA